MATPITESLTPKERALLRTGKCNALGCRGCEYFVLDKFMDGFNTCDCGHTQHSHAMPALEQAVQS